MTTESLSDPEGLKVTRIFLVSFTYMTRNDDRKSDPEGTTDENKVLQRVIRLRGNRNYIDRAKELIRLVVRDGSPAILWRA